MNSRVEQFLKHPDGSGYIPYFTPPTCHHFEKRMVYATDPERVRKLMDGRMYRNVGFFGSDELVAKVLPLEIEDPVGWLQDTPGVTYGIMKNPASSPLAEHPLYGIKNFMFQTGGIVYAARIRGPKAQVKRPVRKEYQDILSSRLEHFLAKV